jgi:hypothetical protein
MKRVKVILVLVALVAITGLVSDAWAQCAQPRLFRSSGKFGNNVRVDPTGSNNAGNQIGRLWDSDNANFSNSGLNTNGALCPASQWWLAQVDGNMAVDGFLTSVGCTQMGCPLDKLTVVVEDYDAAGPPGVGGTAYYVGWLTDETPASGRWYDYGEADGAAALTVVPIAEFPKVDISGSSRAGMTINVNYNLADQDANVLSWDHNGPAPFPVSATVQEWQLMKATGLADPGRARAGWTLVEAIPYVPGGTAHFNAIPCTDIVNDEWLAIGIGFNGGAAGAVNSALVGEAVQLECDPNIADPGGQIHEIQKKKPDASELQAQPGRTGGRR